MLLELLTLALLLITTKSQCEDFDSKLVPAPAMSDYFCLYNGAMVPAYDICIMLENGLTSNRLTANTVGYYNCGEGCDVGGTACASGYCISMGGTGYCSETDPVCDDPKLNSGFGCDGSSICGGTVKAVCNKARTLLCGDAEFCNHQMATQINFEYCGTCVCTYCGPHKQCDLGYDCTETNACGACNLKTCSSEGYDDSCDNTCSVTGQSCRDTAPPGSFVNSQDVTVTCPYVSCQDMTCESEGYVDQCGGNTQVTCDTAGTYCGTKTISDAFTGVGGVSNTCSYSNCQACPETICATADDACTTALGLGGSCVPGQYSGCFKCQRNLCVNDCTNNDLTNGASCTMDDGSSAGTCQPDGINGCNRCTDECETECDSVKLCTAGQEYCVENAYDDTFECTRNICVDCPDNGEAQSCNGRTVNDGCQTAIGETGTCAISTTEPETLCLECVATPTPTCTGECNDNTNDGVGELCDNDAGECRLDNANTCYECVDPCSEYTGSCVVDDDCLVNNIQKVCADVNTEVIFGNNAKIAQCNEKKCKPNPCDQYTPSCDPLATPVCDGMADQCSTETVTFKPDGITENTRYCSQCICDECKLQGTDCSANQICWTDIAGSLCGECCPFCDDYNHCTTDTGLPGSCEDDSSLDCGVKCERDECNNFCVNNDKTRDDICPVDDGAGGTTHGTCQFDAGLACKACNLDVCTQSAYDSDCDLSLDDCTYGTCTAQTATIGDVDCDYNTCVVPECPTNVCYDGTDMTDIDSDCDFDDDGTPGDGTCQLYANTECIYCKRNLCSTCVGKSRDDECLLDDSTDGTCQFDSGLGCRICVANECRKSEYDSECPCDSTNNEICVTTTSGNCEKKECQDRCYEYSEHACETDTNCDVGQTCGNVDNNLFCKVCTCEDECNDSGLDCASGSTCVMGDTTTYDCNYCESCVNCDSNDDCDVYDDENQALIESGICTTVTATGCSDCDYDCTGCETQEDCEASDTVTYREYCDLSLDSTCGTCTECECIGDDCPSGNSDDNNISYLRECVMGGIREHCGTCVTKCVGGCVMGDADERCTNGDVCLDVNGNDDGCGVCSTEECTGTNECSEDSKCETANDDSYFCDLPAEDGCGECVQECSDECTGIADDSCDGDGLCRPDGDQGCNKCYSAYCDTMDTKDNIKGRKLWQHIAAGTVSGTLDVETICEMCLCPADSVNRLNMCYRRLQIRELINNAWFKELFDEYCDKDDYPDLGYTEDDSTTIKQCPLENVRVKPTASVADCGCQSVYCNKNKEWEAKECDLTLDGGCDGEDEDCDREMCEEWTKWKTTSDNDCKGICVAGSGDNVHTGNGNMFNVMIGFSVVMGVLGWM